MTILNVVSNLIVVKRYFQSSNLRGHYWLDVFISAHNMFDNATDYVQISILFVCIINRKNIVFLCPIVTIKCFSFGTIGQLMNETFIVWHNVTHIIINALLMEKENIIMASYLIIIVPNQQMYTQRLYTNINDYCLI